jgi:transposase
MWWKFDCNYEDVRRFFIEKFKYTHPPCRQAIYKLNRRIKAAGSVADLPHSGHPKSVTSEENLQLAAEAFIQSPKKSARRASKELQFSDRSLRRMLKTLHLKPYKPTLLHALNEDDPDRRREFCEWYVIPSESNPNFYKTLL